MKKWLVAGALAAMLTGCNNDGPQMQQERAGEIIDEREDEQLNDPATEYRTEQVEDRLGE
jgi:hypothetical protein